ncbi:MAG TPA: metalloregulator ArsR/SmtB family transcription factor [Myxococcota bacterium]|nr:metalloregulator ArsR/SmtB family transcription factor [Myxococcota bacterium]
MKVERSRQAAPTRRLKGEVFEQFARIGKAIASPKRLELLDILCQGPRRVERLAELTQLSVANTSQHLQVLRAARLVEAEKQGLFVQYCLSEGVESFYLSLRHLAEQRLAEVEVVTRSFWEERGAMEQVGGGELLQRALSGQVTVLDVRPAEEFRAGHLPYARSMPLEELHRRMAELPRGVDVVAYCRGPYCVFAMEAVQVLEAAGFVARRLEEGPPEWRAAGVPLVAES